MSDRSSPAFAEIEDKDGRRRGSSSGAAGAWLREARWGRKILAVVAVLGLVLGPLPPARPAYAVAVVVTSLVDDVGVCPHESLCTLRTALASAPPGETVQFGVTGVFRLAAPLILGKNVTILGPGAGVVAIDGQHANSVVEIQSGAQVAMLGLTVQNGTASDGGGIRNSGTLTLTNSAVTGNAAPTSSGGGIYNTDGGTLTIISSTLTKNSASAGGAIANGNGTVTVRNTTIANNVATHFGGAITSTGGTMSVIDSTLSMNSATNQGGAIANFAALTVTGSTLIGNSATSGGAISNAGAGSVSVISSTVSGNSATDNGGGIDNSATTNVLFSTLSGNTGPMGSNLFQLTQDGNSLSLRNSIVVAGSSGQNCGGDPVTSLGNNLSDTTSCFAGGTRGDVVSNAPKLGPLELHGPGLTKTHALLPGSPAIDGVTFNPTDCPGPTGTDQRGVPRPQGRATLRCDIGAFELEADTPPTIDPIGPQTTDEDMPIGVAVTVGDAETAAGSLTLTASSSNQALVPNASVTFGAGGATRTVTIQPVANQSGTTNITLTVDDGTSTTSATFTLTVVAVNDAPVNAVPGAQVTDESTPLAFTAGKNNLIGVSDVDADTLQVALTSTHGTLTLNGTNGLTVVGGANGSPSAIVSGSPASLNNALHGLTFTPTAGYHGPATLQIETSDQGATGSGGPKKATDTIAITVNAVNDSPIGVNDSYSIGAGQTLTVPVVMGLLANDTDPEGVTLTAVLVQGPAHGSLNLNPNGGFSYSPGVGFAGTDSFTYRASDGGQASSPATVTITVAPTQCVPRPKVVPAPVAGGGRLNVHVESTPLSTQQNNPLKQIVFSRLDNAKVTIGGQPIAAGQTFTAPANTFAVDFAVERVTPGQPTTVRFKVIDGCGAWETFVGGGTAAGF